jgi:hypothetical protein
MHLADKELGDFIGGILVYVGATGHAEAVKRIAAVDAKTQRPQDLSLLVL